MPTSTAATRPETLASKLNWLRAGVLGANDGVVSVAGLVMGVAGATSDSFPILVAGIAGLIAGALSMAGGEYVSVSSQRDTEQAAIENLKRELASDPDGELAALRQAYVDRGLSDALAAEVALELTNRDALAAHAEVDLGIDAQERTSPWVAAFASAAAFTVGALIPLLAMVIAPQAVRAVSTVIAVLLALGITGVVSAQLSHSPMLRPVARNLIVGSLAMGLTYLAGSLVGG